MIFNTWSYAVFLILSVLIYWALPQRWRNIWLIIAGIIFYTYQIPAHTILILGISILIYMISLGMLWAMDEGNLRGKKLFFTIGVLLSVLVLGYYKYWKMIVATWNSFIDQLALERSLMLPEVYILVPLAISFFTFEYIHYLTDVYQGKIKNRSFKSFLLFIVFFPTLVAGPIKRFEPFNEQAKKGMRFSIENLSYGGYRIMVGLAKKMILADGVSPWADRLMSPERWDPLMLWFAVFAYSFKIYFDFSGYSDIAIGSARLFGFKIPENFNWPYLQRNISKFWNHWHISLSSWIRDYIFIPLGGSRGNPVKVFLTFMLVMAISGLWHGAAWNFVAWGLYHGFGLAVYNVYRKVVLKPLGKDKRKDHEINWVSRIAATLFTFLFVSVGWVLFAVTSFGEAIEVYKKIFFLY